MLVRKNDGSLRFYFEYRKLNNRTVIDAYALPHIDETIDSLFGSKVFFKLDPRSGYWQIPIKNLISRKQRSILLPPATTNLTVCRFVSRMHGNIPTFDEILHG